MSWRRSGEKSVRPGTRGPRTRDRHPYTGTGTDMSEQTPSQAEGEREQDAGPDDEQRESDTAEAPRTTPSQAEGEAAGEK